MWFSFRVGNISHILCWEGKKEKKRDHVYPTVKLHGHTNTIKHKSPTPPWSLYALMVTPPTQVSSIVSRQKGGLAQTAVLCRKHCAGHTLAASGGLISCAQLFPFVTVDCGWALCWGVGLCNGVGSGAGGVNRLCVCVLSLLTHICTALMGDFEALRLYLWGVKSPTEPTKPSFAYLSVHAETDVYSNV